MNKTSTILKPYLRKFILQTHPDFFHNEYSKKQINAASLQKLYNVLQPEKHNAVKATCQLEFYTKQQQNKNKKKEQPKAIGQFDCNDSEWTKANSFFQLCKQLDIPILQSDLDIVNDMISKEINKNKPKNQYKSLTIEFANRLYKQHNEPSKTTEWKSSQILSHNLVMFDPQVNKKTFSNKLILWLPQLQPERWWGKVPIMVISPGSELLPKELTKGILIIKSDMELEGNIKYKRKIQHIYCLYLDVKNYFDTHLDEIIKENSK